MSTDLSLLIQSRQKEKSALYGRYINPQKARATKLSGFDVQYVKGEDCYLYDADGNRYLDCDAGAGVFCLGRNHPRLRASMHALLDMNPPNMVFRDTPLLPALLAEALAKRTPGDLNRVLFTNSGSETVEVALKVARRATGRPRLLFVEGDFHGVTYGALSVTDTGSGLQKMSDGLGPMLPACDSVPRNDLNYLENKLARGDVAGLIVEPVQGASVTVLEQDFLQGAQSLCRKFGSLFIVDEVFVGMGRTGRLFASEHFSLEPDVLVLSKALSGGYVPVGALVTRESLHEKAHKKLGAFVHGSTFGENDFGAAAGLVTLDTLDDEGLIANAAEAGNMLRDGLLALQSEFDMIRDVRGMGLLVGIEFGAPNVWGSRLSGRMLESKGMLGLMMMMQLMDKHRILSSTAGRNNVLRLHPPLTVRARDVAFVLESLRAVLQDSHRFPGGIGRLLIARLLRAVRRG